MENNELVRLSFVVPVYNVGAYICDCVDSLERLPIDPSEFEIIIINDGSTDNSSLKCKFLEEKFTNVKYISIANSGVSNARNEGIKLSAGKYICFVDGDDFHANGEIAEMLHECEKNNLDIVRGKYYIYKNGCFIKNNTKNRPFYKKIISGPLFLKYSLKFKENEVVPWLGLYKKSFLEENAISFNRTISYEEDHVFFLSCLMATKKCRIMQTDNCFYSYRYRDDSVTKTPTLKQAKDVIAVVQLEEQIAKDTKEKKYRKYIRKYASASFYQLTSIYGRVDKASKKEINKMAVFKIKIRCLLHPYNSHQFVKIFLFTFCRWIVDMVYCLKKHHN